MKKIFRPLSLLLPALLVLFAVPVFASAAGSGGPCPFGQMLDANNNCVSTSGAGINIMALTPYSSGILFIINSILVPVLFAIAFLTFIWGVYKYFILGADNETDREKGRNFVFWGIIGFVVILSIWGLVAVVGSTFQLNTGGAAPNYPIL